MANLKEIRTRITSVESTMQITSAMKMVSAAKLKRAQDAITQMRPFAKKFNEILLEKLIYKIIEKYKNITLKNLVIEKLTGFSKPTP